jgi:ATP-dependent RNA helicase RhlE
MGGAQTGTGKTAGFTLPLLNRLARHASTSASPARHPVRALILAPTRELAMQVFESVKMYSKHLPLRSTCIYGGVDMNPQIQELRRGIEIVVATPGRLLDHVQQKTIALGQVDSDPRRSRPHARHGLHPRHPAHPRPAAGQPPEPAVLRHLLRRDQEARRPDAEEPAADRSRPPQHGQRDHHPHRPPVSSGLKRNLLAHIVRHEDETNQVLVFVDTKFACSRLAHFLERHGISADSIHGDKSQQARTETLENFKSGKVRVLVATDVAARGLDIEDLPSVINFELPHTAEDYVHRIGRTGRAGKKGKAVSLVSSEERHRLADIQKLIKLEIKQEIVPGYDPEPDFFDADGSRRRRSAPASRPAEPPQHRGRSKRWRTPQAQ